MSRRSVLLGAGAVAAFLAVDLGTMAYANNWIRPRDLTRQSFIDAFRTVFGVHPSFRANHAKGVAVTVYFDSNGNAGGLSHAAVVRSGRVPLPRTFGTDPGPCPSVRRSVKATGVSAGYAPAHAK